MNNTPETRRETELEDLLNLYKQYKQQTSATEPKRAPRAMTLEEVIESVNPYYSKSTSQIHAKW
jgi:hypothetical protein